MRSPTGTRGADRRGNPSVLAEPAVDGRSYRAEVTAMKKTVREMTPEELKSAILHSVFFGTIGAWFVMGALTVVLLLLVRK